MATQKSHDATGKMMTQLRRRIVHVNIRWSIVDKITVLRRFLRFIWQKILACSPPNMPNTALYRRLSRNPSSPPSMEAMESGGGERHETTPSTSGYDGDDSDLVSLKISILGDCEIGKTTFVVIILILVIISLFLCF